jgi:hypothetical protein
MLTFDQLKAAGAERERTLTVPELAETIRVKLFTKRELDQIRAEATVSGEVKPEKLERLVFMRGLLDPAVTEAQYQELLDGSAAIYLAITTAIMEENGLTALSQRDARRAFSARS